MHSKEKWIIFLIAGGLLLNAPCAESSVILNEIFSDPPSGLIGDANNDGVRSSRADEFIELFNIGANEVNLSNWYLTDSVSTRHIFPSRTVLAPYTFLAVFGGGTPNLSGIHWQVASSGSLGLNNGGDSVSLFDMDGQLIDQVVYGNIGSHDQSITLSPDGQGEEFFLHSGLAQARGALFSPGTSIDSKLLLALSGQEDPNGPVVPELPTLVYFMVGLGSVLLKRKN